MRCAAGLWAVLFRAVLLWGAGTSAADAATVTLAPVAPPASYAPGGHRIDVLGITPGMQPDAVRALLTSQYGTAVVTQDSLALEDRGAAIQTQPYVTLITAQSDSDQITVWFGTPTTGNGVVEVTRQLSYRDETAAPEIQQVRAELVAKYGKPGLDGAAPGTGEVQLLGWAFRGNAAVPCAKSSCRGASTEGMDIRNLPAYARALKTGSDLTVVVTLVSGISDPSRASGMVITMSDAATKVRSLEAAVSQMRAASGRKAPKGGE